MNLIPDFRSLSKRGDIEFSEVLKLQSYQYRSGNVVLLKLLNNRWLKSRIVHPCCNLSWSPQSNFTQVKALNSICQRTEVTMACWDIGYCLRLHCCPL